ncbi:copper transporter [Orenia marismortui]|uniref:Copper transport outer membrane protein MctB n=1 Tax=Orenia marismortui TaxID=46469 RepID=A0A4R8GY35_9FIRM|nr:copper transporter [Orenia marismortui]TDX51196.1 copper transport outer membrane protein MctB [Orenia marismortui]
MLVDIRYHIITVVIIFVTLAIGILIGSSMLGNDLIIEEQKNLVSKLEDDFRYLRSENKQFEREVNTLEARLADNIKFQKMIMPLVVKGQLEKQSLLLVVGNNISSDLKNRLIKALKLANAESISLVDGISDIEIKGEFSRVLFLGEVNKEIKDYYSKLSKGTIKINSDELNNISGLIKLVFEVASKDLADMRGVASE